MAFIYNAGCKITIGISFRYSRVFTKKFYGSDSTTASFKVAICGACGGIGQPLSLLLKDCPDIAHLSLYDRLPLMAGVGCDLSHISTSCRVTGYSGSEQLFAALKEADIVMIPAGVPRKPGMNRDDLFNINAGIVSELVGAAAKACPNALIGIISNPVNSTVPIAAEVLTKAGVFDPRRLFGVTTLDVVRAMTFVGEVTGTDPRQVSVPVIGGHSGVTIVPVLSRCHPSVDMDDEQLVDQLVTKIREAGTAVVKAKSGGGSATLAMAYAGARFTLSLIEALKGNPYVIECAYVRSDVVPGVKYFATPLLLGKGGVVTNIGVPQLNEREESMVIAAVPELQKNIQRGEEYEISKKFQADSTLGTIL